MTQSLYLKLNEVRYIKEKMKEKQALIESMRYALIPGGVDYSRDRAQTSPQDTMPKQLMKILCLEDELRVLDQEVAAAQDRVLQIINRLEDSTMRSVMIRKYVGLMSMNEIAEQMSYSESSIYKMHTKAIKILDRIPIYSKQ